MGRSLRSVFRERGGSEQRGVWVGIQLCVVGGVKRHKSLADLLDHRALSQKILHAPLRQKDQEGAEGSLHFAAVWSLGLHTRSQGRSSYILPPPSTTSELRRGRWGGWGKQHL